MRFTWNVVSAGVGLLLLFVAAILAFLSKPDPATNLVVASKPADVVVMAREVAPGDVIDKLDLTLKRVAISSLPADAIVLGSKDEIYATGSSARRMLTPGEMLRSRDYLRPDQNPSLSNMLNPGMRAVSIPLDPVQSKTAIIIPEDRVDILGLSSFGALTANGVSTTNIRPVLLQNLRVLAVDGKTQITDKSGATSDPKAKVTSLQLGAATSITVEVPAALAPQLAAAVANVPPAVMLRRQYDANVSAQALNDLRMQNENDAEPTVPIEAESFSRVAAQLGSADKSLSDRNSLPPAPTVLVIRGEP